MGRGLLTFKGDKKPKSKSKTKKKKSSRSDVVISAATVSTLSSSASSCLPPTAAVSTLPERVEQTQEKKKHEQSNPQIQQGAGRISSSGTVVTGYGTKFNSEFSTGDALLVRYPQSNQDEMRVVTMRLSDVSCGISSAFSCDLRDATAFSYVLAPRDEKKIREKEHKAREEEERETERTAFGTYSARDTLVYRKKTETGSYVIQREKLDQDVTRGDLLNLRAKKKSDRYC